MPHDREAKTGRFTSRPHDAADLTPNPEELLNAAEKEVRRELMKLENPVSAAAIMIAGLRADLEKARAVITSIWAREPKP